MQQIKIFTALESDVSLLEQQVNQWLKSNPNIRVVRISGNIAPQSEATTGRIGGLSSGGNASDVLLILLYEFSPKA